MFWGGGSGASSAPTTPTSLSPFRDLGPVQSSWFFRPVMAVVSLRLPGWLGAASWQTPHSPSWLVATCVSTGGRGWEVPGSGSEKRGEAPCSLLTLQAPGPEDGAALLSPCCPLWPQWDLGWWVGRVGAGTEQRVGEPALSDSDLPPPSAFARTSPGRTLPPAPDDPGSLNPCGSLT